MLRRQHGRAAKGAPVADELGARGVARKVALVEGDEHRLLEQLLVVRGQVAHSADAAAVSEVYGRGCE